MKVKDSLYFEYKKLMQAAKEVLLNEKGAPKEISEIPQKDFDLLLMKTEMMLIKLGKAI